MIFSYFYCYYLSLVQCNTNPCQLGGSFTPPNYNCIQLLHDSDVVICTCPNGQGRKNAPCRKTHFFEDVKSDDFIQNF